MRHAPGETAVVVPVPGAEHVVGRFRAIHDSSALVGMPAHITLLFPFLPEEQLRDGAVVALRRLFSSWPPVSVEFRRTGRFPGVVYLVPEPVDMFVRLTDALVELWPEAPPYGGAYNDVVPHLTVAADCTEEAADSVEQELRRCLPLEASLEGAALYAFDGVSWAETEFFRFRAHA
jgi:2'-5' RNA ligase